MTAFQLTNCNPRTGPRQYIFPRTPVLTAGCIAERCPVAVHRKAPKGMLARNQRWPLLAREPFDLLFPLLNFEELRLGVESIGVEDDVGNEPHKRGQAQCHSGSHFAAIVFDRLGLPARFRRQRPSPPGGFQNFFATLLRAGPWWLEQQRLPAAFSFSFSSFPPVVVLYRDSFNQYFDHLLLYPVNDPAFVGESGRSVALPFPFQRVICPPLVPAN